MKAIEKHCPGMLFITLYTVFHTFKSVDENLFLKSVTIPMDAIEQYNFLCCLL